MTVLDVVSGAIAVGVLYLVLWAWTWLDRLIDPERGLHRGITSAPDQESERAIELWGPRSAGNEPRAAIFRLAGPAHHKAS